jgi:hypothetical protein
MSATKNTLYLMIRCHLVPLLAHSRKLAGTPERVRTWGLTGPKVAVSAGPLLLPQLRQRAR